MAYSNFPIAFIQTGGTIDKDYPRRTGGYAFEIDEPAFTRMLEKFKPNFEFNTYSACRKDSLDITDEDRQKLGEFINGLSERNIIVTHGTDSLIETAKYLEKVDNKTIIVTGAKLPERFTDSDAPFNLGVAVGAIQSMDQGVYVCMQGLVIPAAKASRDINTGYFSESGE